MADPFDSPKWRLARAKDKIVELEASIASYIEKNPSTPIKEHDPKTGRHVMKIRFTPQPTEWPVLVSEILEHLRHTLDQAMYAAAQIAGVAVPKNAYFPFSDTAANLENVIKGRCSDVPTEVLAVARRFKPYKTGNFTLWALNKTANRKHTLLMPIGAAGAEVSGLIVDIGGDPVTIKPRWDREKNELVVLDLQNVKDLNYHLQVTSDIAFDDVEPVSGQPVRPMLRAMTDMVDQIGWAIEIACRRHFPAKF